MNEQLHFTHAFPPIVTKSNWFPANVFADCFFFFFFFFIPDSFLSISLAAQSYHRLWVGLQCATCLQESKTSLCRNLYLNASLSLVKVSFIAAKKKQQQQQQNNRFSVSD